MVAGAFGRLGTLGILPKLMRGAHLGHPKVSRFPARAVTLTWSRPMPVQMEGEIQPPRAALRGGAAAAGAAGAGAA
jgi:diacylglycerol kinase (ATP)